MKILTALQDPKTNEILKEKTKHNIIETDIQYQEGILETLEKNNKIDLIIISQLLPGNIGFKDLINKIKIINNNIEIIAILENKNNELKDFLKQKNINSIFYNNEITIDELINVIEEKDKNKKEMEINKEIKLLKEIILENNKKIDSDGNVDTLDYNHNNYPPISSLYPGTTSARGLSLCFPWEHHDCTPTAAPPRP